MNLVVNARDAMPQGGTLSIQTANSESWLEPPAPKRGACVLLIVSDTGIGMDEETRRRIFEPFFTTKKEGVGTGLGLATVYGIVQQCGGWIDFTSAPGEGARFVIGLPRTNFSAVSTAAETDGRGQRGAGTVLVVEDQDDVRQLAILVLRSHGYQLLEARNAVEALAIAERHPAPIHLMLTDVVMPGLNGKDLAAQLRPLRPDMRVLYMSGYSENVIASEAVINGDVEYIPKPFSPNGLAAKVRAILQASRG
jgi:two-component system, cell cycle sensor histidine kinase and response regulator CckA